MGFFLILVGGFWTISFFQDFGFFLNIEGFFLNIGGFLDNLIFSNKKFQFFVLEAKQSLQTASGAPWVATRCLSGASKGCAPCQGQKGDFLPNSKPNGPGLGGIWITLAPMYPQGLLIQPIHVRCLVQFSRIWRFLEQVGLVVLRP